MTGPHIVWPPRAPATSRLEKKTRNDFIVDGLKERGMPQTLGRKMSLLAKLRGAQSCLIWGRDFVGEEDFYCQASLPSGSPRHREPSRKSTATRLRGGSRLHHCLHPEQVAATVGMTVEAACVKSVMLCINLGYASQSHWGPPHVRSQQQCACS